MTTNSHSDEIERSIEVIRSEMGKVGKTLSPETEKQSRELFKHWGLEFRVTTLMESLESDKDKWIKIKKTELEQHRKAN